MALRLIQDAPAAGGLRLVEDAPKPKGSRTSFFREPVSVGGRVGVGGEPVFNSVGATGEARLRLDEEPPAEETPEQARLKRDSAWIDETMRQFTSREWIDALHAEARAAGVPLGRAVRWKRNQLERQAKAGSLQPPETPSLSMADVNEQSTRERAGAIEFADELRGRIGQWPNAGEGEDPELFSALEVIEQYRKQVAPEVPGPRFMRQLFPREMAQQQERDPNGSWSAAGESLLQSIKQTAAGGAQALGERLRYAGNYIPAVRGLLDTPANFLRTEGYEQGAEALARMNELGAQMAPRPTASVYDDPEGWARYFGQQGVASSGLTLAGMGASLVNPALGAATFLGGAGGSEYGRARIEDGASPSEAGVRALTSVATEGIPEMLGGAAMLGRLPLMGLAQSTARGRAAIAIPTEAGTEGLTEKLNIEAERARGKYISPEEESARIKDAVVIGGMLGGGVGTGSAAIESGARSLQGMYEFAGQAADLTRQARARATTERILGRTTPPQTPQEAQTDAGADIAEAAIQNALAARPVVSTIPQNPNTFALPSITPRTIVGESDVAPRPIAEVNTSGMLSDPILRRPQDGATELDALLTGDDQGALASRLDSMFGDLPQFDPLRPMQVGAADIAQGGQSARESRQGRIAPVDIQPMQFQPITQPAQSQPPMAPAIQKLEPIDAVQNLDAMPEESEQQAPPALRGLTTRERQAFASLENEINEATAVRGGTAIVDNDGKVTGRLKWETLAPGRDFWRSRPTQWTADKARSALRKAQAGEDLTAQEKNIVDYARKWSIEYAKEIEADEGGAISDAKMAEREAIRDDIESTLPQIQDQSPQQRSSVRSLGSDYTARLLSLKKDRRAWGLNPDQEQEYQDLLELDRETGKVGGRPIVGVRNKTAYVDAQDEGTLLPVQGFTDADNFKSLNDRLGHETGDDAIREIGTVLVQEFGEGNVFHRGGDEFLFQAQTPEELTQKIERAKGRLSTLRLTAVDKSGNVEEQFGIGLSYGYGATEAEADEALKRDKQARKDAGLRRDRADEDRRIANRRGVGAESAGEGVRSGQGDGELRSAEGGVSDRNANRADDDGTAGRTAEQGSAASGNVGTRQRGIGDDQDRGQPAEGAPRGAVESRTRTVATATAELSDRLGAKFTRKLVAQPWFNLVESIDQVPESIRRSITDPDTVAGFVTEDGQVYIIAGNIDSNVTGVVLHEVGVHYGLPGILGDDFAATLRQFKRLRAKDPRVDEAYKRAEEVAERGKDGKLTANALALLDEEALAYYVEQNWGAKTPIVQRVVDAIKRLLNRLGVPLSKLDASPTLIRDVAVGAARSAAEKGGVNGRSETAYNRTKPERDGTLERGGSVGVVKVQPTMRDGRPISLPIEVVVGPVRGLVDIEILDNGHVRLRWPGWGFTTYSDRVDRVRQAIDDVFKPTMDEGTYWRFTNNKDEIGLARRGELRRSMNHADNKVERGVSVASGAHYSIQGYKYGYKVTGTEIGQGSDGEPLLDPASIKPVSKIMLAADIAREDRAALIAGLRKNLEARGWTLDHYRAAQSHIREMPTDEFNANFADSRQAPPREGLGASGPRYSRSTIAVDGVERPTTDDVVRVIYRGTNDSGERIRGGIAEGTLFAAADEKTARAYAGSGGKVERIGVTADANILVEGTAEFARVTGRSRGKLLDTMRVGENLKTAADDAATKAMAAGYDALEFTSFKDLGIAIFNEDKFVRDLPESDKRIAYSRRTPRERERNLIVQHNISASKLIHADRMGGLAVPSLAVTKADTPLDSFGEITLLGDEQMATPSRDTKVFGADIYSPRYPSVTFKVSGKAVDAINERLAPFARDGEKFNGSSDALEYLTGYEPFRRWAEKDGKLYSDQMQKRAVELLQEVGAQEKIFQGFSYSGNRRYVDHTIDRVVAMLKKDLRGGESFNYGAGSLRAKFTPQFKSIAAIRGAENRLMTKDAFEKVKDEINQELLDVSAKMVPNGGWRATETASSILEDGAKIGLDRAAKEYGVTLTDEARDAAREFLGKLRNLPTAYFEAKVLRAMDIGEFKAAVVPDNVPERARAILEKRGLEIVEYKAGDEASRAAAIASVTQDKGLRFSRRTPQQAQAESAQKQAALAQTVGATPGQTFAAQDRFTDDWKGTLRKAREKIQDKLLSVRDVQQDVEKVRGALDDAMNVYRRENLMHGRVGQQRDQLERTHLKPLLDAMAKARIAPELLEDYVEARHAEERNKAIAKRQGGMPDAASGMTTQAASDFLAGNAAGHRSGVTLTPDLTRTLDRLARRVDAITAETRQRLYQSGQITKQQLDELENAYQFYVPLRGKDGEEDTARGGTGKGIDVRGKPIQRALGRGDGNRAVNILAEVVADAERSIITAEKARVGRTLARLVIENPNPDVWAIEPVKTEQAYSESADEIYMAVKNLDQDPNTIIVKVSGKPYRIYIEDTRIAEALKNLAVEQLPVAVNIMAGINRYFSAVLTRYNPSFVAVNLVRDMIFGMTGLAAEHGAKSAADAAKNYLPAMRAMWREARGTLGNSRMDRFASEFAEAGGKTYFGKLENVPDIAQRIGMEFKTARQIAINERRPLAAIGKLAKDSRMVQAIENANDAVENALRLAAYAARREAGDSVEKAAEYAKNLTVNFNRRGAATSWLNALYLFFNASVQGSHRVFKLLKNRKVQAALGGLALAQAAFAMLAMGYDDEDGEPLWDSIPEWEKQRNFIIVYPYINKDGKVRATLFKITMPYGFNIFPYLGGRTAALANDIGNDKKHAIRDYINDSAAGVLGAMAPLPFGEEGGFKAWLPHWLRLAGMLSENKDDLGIPIRAGEEFDRYDRPRSAKGRDDTSEVFKMAATALNRIGGGDDYNKPMFPWLLDWAPEDLEFIAATAGGGLSGTALKGQRMTEKLIAGVPVSFKDVPILSSFVSNVDQRQATSSRYYERKDEIERQIAQQRDIAKETGNVEDNKLGIRIARNKSGQKIKRGDGYELEGTRGSLFATYKEAEKEITRIRDEMRATYRDSSIDFGERARRIDALKVEREEVQRKVNAKWREVFGRKSR